MYDNWSLLIQPCRSGEELSVISIFRAVLYKCRCFLYVCISTFCGKLEISPRLFWRKLVMLLHRNQYLFSDQFFRITNNYIHYSLFHLCDHSIVCSVLLCDSAILQKQQFNECFISFELVKAKSDFQTNGGNIFTSRP